MVETACSAANAASSAIGARSFSELPTRQRTRCSRTARNATISKLPTRQRTGDAPPEGAGSFLSCLLGREPRVVFQHFRRFFLSCLLGRERTRFRPSFTRYFLSCLLGRELCLNPHNHLIPKKNNAPRIKHPNSRPIYKPLIPLAFIRPSKRVPAAATLPSKSPALNHPRRPPCAPRTAPPSGSPPSSSTDRVPRSRAPAPRAGA